MVYGREKLDTFDESRKVLLEFQNAVMEFIGLVTRIGIFPSLYKYPIKTYRRYVEAVTRVQEYGMFLAILCFSSAQCAVVFLVDYYHVFLCNTGSSILKEKYDKMVDAINSGAVDVNKATCKKLSVNIISIIGIVIWNFSNDGTMAD